MRPLPVVEECFSLVGEVDVWKSASHSWGREMCLYERPIYFSEKSICCRTGKNATARKPPESFQEKPSYNGGSGGGYQKEIGRRTLPAGAEGYGSRGGSRCTNHVIDRVTLS